MSLTIVAVLLAAGASRRMGSPKPLLPIHGIPLICRVAQALREGGADEVIVVVSPDAPGEQTAETVATISGVRTVVNPSPERGMLSSVQVGLAAISDADAFLISPCDLPCLTASDVAAVCAHWSGDSGAIVAPSFEKKRGHPTLFGVSYRKEINELDPETFGLNEILKRFAAHVVEITVNDPSVLQDADTPEEWRALIDGVQ